MPLLAKAHEDFIIEEIGTDHSCLIGGLLQEAAGTFTGSLTGAAKMDWTFPSAAKEPRRLVNCL